jgi:hypothetical protein
VAALAVVKAGVVKADLRPRRRVEVAAAALSRVVVGRRDIGVAALAVVKAGVVKADLRPRRRTRVTAAALVAIVIERSIQRVAAQAVCHTDVVKEGKVDSTVTALAIQPAVATMRISMAARALFRHSPVRSFWMAGLTGGQEVSPIQREGMVLQRIRWERHRERRQRVTRFAVRPLVARSPRQAWNFRSGECAGPLNPPDPRHGADADADDQQKNEQQAKPTGA